MSHSLIGADRGAHLEIVAVSLAAAIAVVMVGVTARVTETGPSGRPQAAVLEAGKPALSARLDATT